MPKKEILIIGSGSQARYVIDILKSHKNLTIAGLVDIESDSRVGKNINGFSILSTYRKFTTKYSPRRYHVIVAYGLNSTKKKIALELAKKGFKFVSAISSLASVSPSAQIGEGCIINPFAVVMPNAEIGDHVILHSHCVVEHDNKIESYSNLAPGVTLAGRVHVGEGATIYTGATVIPDIEIGSWATVAAGAVVIKNVQSKTRVAGVPAAEMRD